MSSPDRCKWLVPLPKRARFPARPPHRQGKIARLRRSLKHPQKNKCRYKNEVRNHFGLAMHWLSSDDFKIVFEQMMTVEMPFHGKLCNEAHDLVCGTNWTLRFVMCNTTMSTIFTNCLIRFPVITLRTDTLPLEKPPR
jgi:hypothetical protein